MSDQNKTQELASINDRIFSLREHINSSKDEISKYVEKRNKLNDQVRSLREEIDVLKQERDSLNKTVRALKQQRDDVRTNISPYLQEIRERIHKVKELKEQRGGVNRRVLQKELDAIEWKIMTSSLDLQEEKRLIEEVKNIGTQLSVYKKMEKQSKKIDDIKSQLKQHQDVADKYHQELVSDAQKSQDIHSKLMVKVNEMKKVREEANALHAKFIEAKEKVQPFYDEISSLMDQKRKLQAEIREEDQTKKKLKEQQIKETIGSQAKEKLDKGEKLNWLEFQLLAGEESESED